MVFTIQRKLGDVNDKKGSGLKVQGSSRPPAKKTAGLIKKETLKSEDQNATKIGMDSHL